MNHVKKISILIPVFLISLILVSAHSLYLFGISLDFDMDLKSNIVSAAQKYASTTNEPVAFDLDRGLIMVHFEPEQRHFVEINPLGYKVQGMRDENLKHKSGAKVITKEKGLEIAKKIYDSLPDDVKSELKADNEVPEVDNTYFFKWHRYIDNVLIAAEDFSVTVDAVNGNVIAFRLAIFEYPKKLIDVRPAITKNVAKRIAELTYNTPSVKDFSPYVIINGNDPVWVNKLQGQFYPYYVGISGKDGSISFTGSLPGDVPKTYKVGDEIGVVETDFIKNIYGEK